MKDNVLKATISQNYDGKRFEQTTTADGAVTYFINGAEVDKPTWCKQAAMAQENEMRNTAGQEPEDNTTSV